MHPENLEQIREQQDKELRIRNNPLSLYPESLDDLLGQSFPATRWIVEGLIPVEGVTIMSAMPGSYKTWMMLEIALCVTQGRKLFGQYETEKVGVLIVDEESGARMLNERFKRLRAPSGLRIGFFSRMGHKITQEYIDSLVSVCLTNDMSLIIFDSLVRLHNGDENSSKDMSELFDLFKQLADNGLSVLIAHHNRKGVPGSYNPSGDMRGSSDILAAVDCHLALNLVKDEFIDVRQTKNRYMRNVSPFRLRFVSEDEHEEFQFVNSLRTKADVKADLKVAIISELLKQPGMTKKQLLEKLNGLGIDIRNGQLSDLLMDLLSSEEVEHKPGVRNATHYFVTANQLAGSAPKTQ